MLKQLASDVSARDSCAIDAAGQNPQAVTRVAPIALFDFFAGCGGTSTGMARAGIAVVAAIESASDPAETFRRNHPKAFVLEHDIRSLKPAVLEHHVNEARRRKQKIMFAACAPCQPFSRQRRRPTSEDPRSYLMLELIRFVTAFEPDFLFCENVPEAKGWKGEKGSPGAQLLRKLSRAGYHHRDGVVDCRDFGVPQRRARWILTAGRNVSVSWPNRTHGPGRPRPWSTVGQWIGGLPPLDAGGTDPEDPIHRAANLSGINLERIRATPVGGSRLDWPEHLELACHRGSRHSFSDVYGRLRLDEPATAMTTRCISLSNGRFGHPHQDRALSAREAALLQTFPPRYRFAGTLESIAAQIGNAVPVLLAERFARRFITAAGGRG
jgi:DNA (cytosine-5)-methyltransferase 1